MIRRVGIRDVAAEAGVSVTTVSHALRGGGQMSATTRTRVIDAADRLQYTPNRLASALRQSRSGLIGFVSDEISTTPFAGRVVLGAQDAAAENDLLLVVVNSNGDAAIEAKQIRTLLDHQVDGIIYARMFHQWTSFPDSLTNLPTVLVDAVTADAEVPAIVPDEVGIGKTATDFLVAAGHRRIGHITVTDDVPAHHGRLAGYRLGLEAAGIPFDEVLVARDISRAPGGRRAAAELLALDDPPTAIFAFNDQMAMGAYQAAADIGLQIPRDLSVVGVDDLELITEGVVPPLTTVALPHYEMGRWAVERLNRLVGQKDAIEPEGDHVFRYSCQLVERDSVAVPIRVR